MPKGGARTGSGRKALKVKKKLLQFYLEPDECFVINSIVETYLTFKKDALLKDTKLLLEPHEDIISLINKDGSVIGTQSLKGVNIFKETSEDTE